MAYSKRSNDKGGRGDRGERPKLYDAVCGDCGKDTLVPFRPGDRAVYCRECFNKRGGAVERGREAGSRNGHEKHVKDDVRHLLEQVNVKLDRLILAVEARDPKK